MNKKAFLIFVLFIAGIFLLSSCSKDNSIGKRINENDNSAIDNEKISDKLSNGRRCLDHEECRSGYCGATKSGDGICMDDPGKGKR